MGGTQIAFGVILVVVLLTLAVVYGVRQIATLRRLRDAAAMPLDERQYLRRRAWRRLLSSLLLLVLGVMLSIDLLVLEGPAQQLADQRDQRRQRGDEVPLDAEQLVLARRYGGFFLVFLVVLMIVVILAALDYWATRRYGLGQRLKLLADRRAMIERELARLREERDGQF